MIFLNQLLLSVALNFLAEKKLKNILNPKLTLLIHTLHVKEVQTKMAINYYVFSYLKAVILINMVKIMLSSLLTQK